jgi:hypothetical protein
MDTVYVKPSKGARIRQPERGGQVMSDSGALVPRDVYYERLIIGGDVIESDPPKASSENPKPAPAPDKTAAVAPSSKD